MSRLALPVRPQERQLRSIALERHADCLQLRLTLMDGAVFVLPATEEMVRGLGQACREATDRILIAS